MELGWVGFIGSGFTAENAENAEEGIKELAHRFSQIDTD